MTNENFITSEGSHPKRFLPSIATMSLGSSTLHSLDTKLKVAAAKGFLGVELYWDDLVQYSLPMRNKISSHALREATESSLAVLLAAADIAKLAASLHLRIISLQPFRNFDGLRNPELREKRLAEFKLWVATARQLGTNIIGVPSTLPIVDLTDYTGNRHAAAADLAALSRLAKRQGVRIAYENLCFAAHVKDWEQAWDRIQLAGEPKQLLFLPDTFNICGQTYMNPEDPSGRTPDGAVNLQASLQKLIDTVPMHRMPLLQVADAELLDSPLTPDHSWRKETGLTPLMALSRNARLFPFEETGYLPVLRVIQALVSAGWEGWVSMEVFSRTTQVEGEKTIWEHAERAWRSWEKLANFMGWQVQPLA